MARADQSRDENQSPLQAERMQILRMIEAGSVSAEEGARLLEAMQIESSPAASGEADAPALRVQAPRRLHVRVTNTDTGQRKVDINLPWSLVSVGINMGARFAPRDIDMEQVMTSIEPGRPGKVMDIVDEDDRERVEIYVE